MSLSLLNFLSIHHIPPPGHCLSARFGLQYSSQFLDCTWPSSPLSRPRCFCVPLALVHSNAFDVFPNHISPSFSAPQRGCGWGSQPNRVDLGILWSSMRARWPSHSSLLLSVFSAAVSVSPHLHLTSVIVIRSAHCWLSEIPSMVLIHLWWNVFSFLICLLSGVQHSAPYNNTDMTQAW